MSAEEHRADRDLTEKQKRQMNDLILWKTRHFLVRIFFRFGSSLLFSFCFYTFWHGKQAIDI